VFTDISQVPYDHVDARTVLLRLVEAIGYRFHRAMHGIEAAHMNFRPADGAKTIGELVHHIGNLVQITHCCVEGREIVRTDLQAAAVLDALSELHHAIAQRDEAELAAVRAPGDRSPFLLINGPLADALTHIGQINTYKRILGIGSPSGSYMDGTKAT